MAYPKVSILWVNYNSSSFINVVLESLQGIKELDYPNYEFIAVDNGSTDGSFEVIKSFVEKMENGKIIRLEENLGFTGGNNVAYKARDPESKYVVLLNNDAIPSQESLKSLIESMESDKSLGATQGVVLNYDGESIDTAGDFISELLMVYPLFKGEKPNVLKKPIHITYSDGSYSVYRVDAIKKAIGAEDKLFDDFMFAYYDDIVIGLKLWNSGFKVLSLPFVAARHRRSSSFRKIKSSQIYLGQRGMTVLNEISNSRYKDLIRFLLLKGTILWPLSEILSSFKRRSKESPNLLKMSIDVVKLPLILLRSFRDGLKIGRMKRELGESLDLYKAPIVKIDLPRALLVAATFHGAIEKCVREQLKEMVYDGAVEI